MALTNETAHEPYCEPNKEKELKRWVEGDSQYLMTTLPTNKRFELLPSSLFLLLQNLTNKKV